MGTWPFASGMAVVHDGEGTVVVLEGSAGVVGVGETVVDIVGCQLLDLWFPRYAISDQIGDD